MEFPDIIPNAITSRWPGKIVAMVVFPDKPDGMNDIGTIPKGNVERLADVVKFGTEIAAWFRRSHVAIYDGDSGDCLGIASWDPEWDNLWRSRQ